jgi:cysteine desulfurase
VVELPVTPQGILDVDAFRSSLGQGACLVSVMAVNNETGVLQPLDSVGRECARLEVPLHVDAVQAFGKVPFSVALPGLAAASLSSHKIGGPKGAGALVVRAGWRLHRELHGGGQERGRRAGTENVAAIVGFGAAAEFARSELEARRSQCARLEARFLAELRRRNVEFVVRGGAAAEGRAPGVLNLGFPGFSGEGMLLGLDLLGVSVSLGSACSSGAAKMSHVLAAMGVSKQENLESVRFSMGPALTESDVEAAADAVLAVQRRSREKTTR